MNKKTITFIGAGNMSAAIIAGLIKKGVSPETIWASNPSRPKLDALRAQFGIQTTTDNGEAARAAEIIVLGVKPHVISTVIHDIAPSVQQKTPLIISMAVGIPLTALQAVLGDDYPFVRSMPNTPAFIGCGATGLYAPPHMTQKHREDAAYIFNAVGLSVWLDEEAHIDLVAALSGSGPAYFFQIIEHLIQGATELGLPAKTATALAKQTALGAARMACESPLDLTTLRKNVTSPGGTTAAALHALAEHTGNLPELLTSALKAATMRAKELAQGK